MKNFNYKGNDNGVDYQENPYIFTDFSLSVLSKDSRANLLPVCVSNSQLESAMLHLQILGPVCSSIIGILMENSHGDPSPLEYCLTQKVLGLETPLGLREEWMPTF